MSWQVDVDVVGRVVGAEPGQVDALAADLQAALVLERLLRRRPGRVVVAQQEAARLLVADADDVLVVEEGRRSAVVGVVVRVDEVGHLVADAVGRGDLVDGPPDVVADGRRGVEQHDAVGCGQERRLVGAVGHRIEVPLDTLHVVALLVQGGAERRLRDRRVVRQVCGVAGACVGKRLGGRVGSAHPTLRLLHSAPRSPRSR